ncbi:DUF2268 domain-containing putative Zn-dependent protease [Hyphobacterium sp. HN65]|uniref:DUF2268 domain-containing putative Zn-dependent protease n=1 Tax=Hyphobacterium lacteum TaxID=3116575 RepID=A0ABU7LLJ1_9PROT|nr:DUF2268 domain-containing putative Zn-dependent protease [Hyphobacterium sp. HN65]MEE2524786.1 DUF2268 domain-containing putative Zn-dependent protease [Hyphobacterium sp. HN65]
MLSLIASAALTATLSADPVSAEFQSNEHHTFSAEEIALIDARLDAVHAEVEAVYPALADTVSVTVIPVHRPALDALGGVTGRAERPGELVVEISVTYPGGIEAAVETGLRTTMAHELHHTVRGWTMQGNHYGHGIQIAVINEGLATVAAEEITGAVNASDLPPENIEEWAEEVLALPQRSNYGEWMFMHPDGREAIGYRTGRWVVRQAMERSGLTIEELTDRSPAAIWALAGFDWDRTMR